MDSSDASRRAVPAAPPVIYLDHHATTPCDVRVVEAMQPYLSEWFGNASSRAHALGQASDRAVDSARREVAGLIGASPREIVFTSGATEADNLAVLGVARAHARAHGRPAHVITCATEHRAVLGPCRALEREGTRVSYVGVDARGRVDLAALEATLEPDTCLVSLMHVNNEIGVIQDLAAVSDLVHARGALLHTDAAQSVGRIPVDVTQLGVDLLSLSGHKFYGPKGIGALYVRRRRPPIRLEPLTYGGGQERGLRSGTLPVALCVGLGRACALAAEAIPADAERLRGLSEHLWARLSRLGGVVQNGDPEGRLPGNLNVSFQGIDAEALLLSVPEVALSTGSACASDRREPSHVLRALGLSRERVQGAVRFGLGRSTTREQVDHVADLLEAQVRRLRELGSRGRRRARG